MTMREEYATALIDRCAQAYPSGFNFEADLKSVQTVADYTDPVNQLKYVHMYFAKSVTLWSRVREILGADDVIALWSIGAGPMLDLFGWFWDKPQSTESVTAVDALDWGAVRPSLEWRQLASHLLPNHEYLDGVVIPEPKLAPQCLGLTATRALPSNVIPNGATVMLPFVLNHIFGAHSSMAHAGRDALVEWVNDIRARDGRIIVADMPSSKTAAFWNTLVELFEVDSEPVVMDFREEIQQLRSLYINDGQGGRRCRYHMADATVLVLDASGGRFLDGT